jgi:hypothetical protein
MVLHLLSNVHVLYVTYEHDVFDMKHIMLVRIYVFEHVSALVININSTDLNKIEEIYKKSQKKLKWY